MEKNTSSELENSIEVPGLSREDANEVAFAALSGDFGNVAPEVKTEEVAAPGEIELPSIEPPAGLRKEVLDKWKSTPREIQEDIARVLNGRDGTLSELHRKEAEIKKQQEELEPIRQLFSEATNYYKLRGEKTPSAKDLVLSLQLVNSLQNSKNHGEIADILEAKGLPVPDALREAPRETEGFSEKKLQELVKNSIQEAVKPLYDKAQEEDLISYRAEMHGHWNEFASAKNEAGGLKYLDVQSDSDPRSLQLAGQIAHLVGGQTDYSKQFIASELARNPSLTKPELFARAYEFYGGKVDHGSKASSSKPNLIKAHRAASSSPGVGTSGRTGEVAPKGLSREQANAYAYRRIQEERG